MTFDDVIYWFVAGMALSFGAMVVAIVVDWAESKMYPRRF